MRAAPFGMKADHAFFQNIKDPHSGVQGGKGVLKNDLHLALGLQGAHSALVQDLLSLQSNLTLHLCTSAQDLDQGLGQRGFAATRLSNQGQGLAFMKLKAHPPDRFIIALGLEPCSGQTVGHPQVLDGQKRMRLLGSQGVGLKVRCRLFCAALGRVLVRVLVRVLGGVFAWARGRFQLHL